MTKSGFESDTVKKLINIVTIAPLVIAGLYSSVVIYDFIFPPLKEKSESIGDYLKRSGSISCFQVCFHYFLLYLIIFLLYFLTYGNLLLILDF